MKTSRRPPDWRWRRELITALRVAMQLVIRLIDMLK